MLEIFWICVMYICVFKLVQYVLFEKTDILKILFNVDVNRIENNSYRLLHFLSGLIVVTLCSIKPFVNCVIYYVVFRFIDITEINYVLLLLSVIRVLQCWDGYEFKYNWYVMFQFVYTIVNYSNVESFTPAMFQLVDELFDIDIFVLELENIYKNLISLDVPRFIFSILSYNKLYTFEKHVTRVVLLSLIGIYSFLYTDLYMSSEFLFYYFVVFRIAQLFMDKKMNRKKFF